MYNYENMKFIDQACLEIIAGKGGDGIISFRHEFRIEKGGPDGGNGGNGGNVYFQGDSGLNTLLSLHMTKHIIGNDGKNGRSKNMYGAKGKDIIVKVPLGTLVYENDNLVHDIIDDKEYLICQGGKGGYGNNHFKSSRNTVPKVCENGALGEKKTVRLELKVMADIGLVGMPSAGKSTILKLISNAKPKIANYHFTTVVPQLGLVQFYENSFVVADLPGLIEGASQGKGLGVRFLKHIERCKLIVFVIDFGEENKDPINDYEILKKELELYNLKLLDKSCLIIANKKDLLFFESNYKKFVKKYNNLEIIKISALLGANINFLKEKMFNLYKKSKNIVLEEFKSELNISLDDEFVINKIHEGLYEITGKKVENIYHINPLNTYENILRFNEKMKDIGV